MYHTADLWFQASACDRRMRKKNIDKCDKNGLCHIVATKIVYNEHTVSFLVNMKKGVSFQSQIEIFHIIDGIFCHDVINDEDVDDQ